MVTVIVIAISALGKVFKSLERRLEELKFRAKIETIQATGQLRSFRIF